MPRVGHGMLVVTSLVGRRRANGQEAEMEKYARAVQENSPAIAIVTRRVTWLGTFQTARKFYFNLDLKGEKKVFCSHKSFLSGG